MIFKTVKKKTIKRLIARIYIADAFSMKIHHFTPKKFAIFQISKCDLKSGVNIFFSYHTITFFTIIHI